MTNQQDSQLKPCPFCGFEPCPEFSGEGKEDIYSEDWTVICDHCGASPISDKVDLETAIYEWNTRAEPSPSRPEQSTFKNFPDAMRAVLCQLGIAPGESEEDLYSVTKWGGAYRQLKKLYSDLSEQSSEALDKQEAIIKELECWDGRHEENYNEMARYFEDAFDIEIDCEGTAMSLMNDFCRSLASELKRLNVVTDKEEGGYKIEPQATPNTVVDQVRDLIYTVEIAHSALVDKGFLLLADQLKDKSKLILETLPTTQADDKE